MHADLVKLLDLQAKDTAVADAERRLKELDIESVRLDQAVQQARDLLDAARRAAADGARRRDEIEARVESYRTLQNRRVQRLETVRRAIDGIGFVDDLAPGDWVSMHWDWVCDRLSRRQLANLRRTTLQQLALSNDGVAHPGPAMRIS